MTNGGRILGAIGIVMLGGCLLVACAHPMSADTMISRADAARKKGHWSQACRWYRILVSRRSLSPRKWYGVARQYARCSARLGRLPADEVFSTQLSARLGTARLAYLRGFFALAAGPGGRLRGKRFLEAAGVAAPNDPEPWYRLGLILLDEEHFGEAMAMLRRASRMRGAGAEVRLALTQALAVQGRLGQALVLLRSVPRADMSLVEVRRGRSVQRLISALGAPLDRAARAVRKRAVMLLSRKLPGRASEVIENAMAEHGDRSALLALLGMAQLRLGNDAQAVVSLTKAIRLNPYDGMSSGLLGSLFLEVGDRAKARRYLERAVAAAPFDLLAHRALGTLLLQDGKSARASDLLAQAVGLSGQAPELVRIWADALQRSGRLASAQAILERLVRRGKGDYSAWMALGDLYLVRFRQAHGQADSDRFFASAKRAYRQALQERPGDPVAKSRLAAMERH